MKSRWLAGICLALALLPGVAAAALNPPRASLVPGGVATFRLPGGADEKPVVTYDGAPVMVLREGAGWLAVVGISLDTEPGDRSIKVEQPGRDAREIAFKVGAKQYRTQQLKVPPGQVNLSAEDEARVGKEQEKTRAAMASF